MKTKKKFICIKPLNFEAEDFFDRAMSGLQSCELLQEKEQMYLLRPIRTKLSFWMKKVDDHNWEVEK